MQKNTIIYIGNFPYPSKSGVGNRVRQNVRLLQSLGYQVSVISISEEYEKNASLAQTVKQINGANVYSLPVAKNIKERVFYWNDLKRTKALLKKINVESGILAVFFTGTKFSLFANGLVNFCKRSRIKVVADSMDWLSIHSKDFLFNLVKRFDIAFEMRIVNKKADGVVAISSYLSSYYQKKGLPTVIIPPLFENVLKNDVDDDSKGTRISLLYAGTPFSPGFVCDRPEALKDRLDHMIDLLYHVKKKGCVNFVFKVYGITLNACKTAFPWLIEKIEFLSDNVVFYGKVTYDIVQKALRNADFTFLVRDNTRETRAGFPSKVAESISCGVPVIITNVADHAKYIQDGVNGFLLSKDFDEEVSKLDSILKIDGKALNILKMNCRMDRQFVYTTYVDEMKKFLQDVLQ